MDYKQRSAPFRECFRPRVANSFTPYNLYVEMDIEAFFMRVYTTP